MTALVFMLGVYIGGVLPMLALGAMASRERPGLEAWNVYFALTWPVTLFKWAGRDLR